MARLLDVPRSSIKIVRGASARDKLLHVEGAAAETLRRRIEEATR